MELNLDLSLVYVPKTMSDFLREVSKTRVIAEKLSKLNDYIKRLEEEMRKIDAFKRELPLCMLLLNDAIARLKVEAVQCAELNDRSVTKEFVPLKENSDGNCGLKSDSSDKKDWLSSVQLWSSDISYDCENQDSVSILKSSSEDENRSESENPIRPSTYGQREEEFMPLKGQSGLVRGGLNQDTEVSGISVMNPIPDMSSFSSVPKNNGGFRACSGPTFLRTQNQKNFETKSKQQNQHNHQQQQQTCRKQRRSWSPELHRRFVEALQQLGGPQAATPKQIRELMQVDSLTNDEVKSHLQKYRLHMKKLPVSSAAKANGFCLGEVQCGEHKSQSVSPKTPLLTNESGRIGEESMETEEDEKSDGQSWKFVEVDHV